MHYRITIDFQHGFNLNLLEITQIHPEESHMALMEESLEIEAKVEKMQNEAISMINQQEMTFTKVDIFLLNCPCVSLSLILAVIFLRQFVTFSVTTIGMVDSH